MNDNIPYPSPANFDSAAQGFDRKKPRGTRVAGLAIMQAMAHQIFWSVNYEVSSPSNFPTPSSENCVSAKALFQSNAPQNVRVHNCVVCVIKPGGLILSEWQVQYSVNISAKGEKKTNPQQKKKSRKATTKFQAKSSGFQPTEPKPKREPLGPVEYFEKLLTTFRNQQKSLKSKFNSVFVTKQNVFKFSTQEMKKHFSEKKRNFSFGLRRIMKKHQEAMKTEKVSSGQPSDQVTTKEEPQLPKGTESYNAVPPKDVYAAIEFQRLSRVISSLKTNDKMQLIAALNHCSQKCAKWKRDTTQCERASHLIRKYDIEFDPELFLKYTQFACKKYKLTLEYLDVVLQTAYLETTRLQVESINLSAVLFCH